MDLPDINAGPGQIRIRNFAASVNPVDVSVRNGSMAQMQKVNPPPYIPGMDAAGVIDQIGEDVETDLKVGDSVMAMVVPSGDHGAYKENIVLDFQFPFFESRVHKVLLLAFYNKSLYSYVETFRFDIEQQLLLGDELFLLNYQLY